MEKSANTTTAFGLNCTATNFNTNNAWGFGGAYGTEYDFGNGLRVRMGKACYRHLPPTGFVCLYAGSRRILDLEPNSSAYNKIEDKLSELAKTGVDFSKHEIEE